MIDMNLSLILEYKYEFSMTQNSMFFLIGLCLPAVPNTNSHISYYDFIRKMNNTHYMRKLLLLDKLQTCQKEYKCLLLQQDGNFQEGMTDSDSVAMFLSSLICAHFLQQMNKHICLMALSIYLMLMVKIYFILNQVLLVLVKEEL